MTERYQNISYNSNHTVLLFFWQELKKMLNGFSNCCLIDLTHAFLPIVYVWQFRSEVNHKPQPGKSKLGQSELQGECSEKLTV